MIKILIADIVLIAIWCIWADSANLTQGAGMLAIFAILGLIGFSAVIGVILKIQKDPWGNAVLINVVLAYFIFRGSFEYMNWNWEHRNNRFYYFTDKDKVYSIILDLNKGRLQNMLDYSIYERIDEHSSKGTDLDGKYWLKGDTILLISSNKTVMKLYKMILYDYPQPGSSKELRNKPE